WMSLAVLLLISAPRWTWSPTTKKRGGGRWMSRALVATISTRPWPTRGSCAVRPRAARRPVGRLSRRLTEARAWRASSVTSVGLDVGAPEGGVREVAAHLANPALGAAAAALGMVGRHIQPVYPQGQSQAGAHAQPRFAVERVHDWARVRCCQRQHRQVDHAD